MPQIFISSSFFSIHWNDWKRSHQKEAKTGRWKTQYDFVNAYLCCLNCVVESPRDVLISVLKFSWFLACTFLFYQGIISFKYRVMCVHMNAYLMKKTKGKFPWEHLVVWTGKTRNVQAKKVHCKRFEYSHLWPAGNSHSWISEMFQVRFTGHRILSSSFYKAQNTKLQQRHLIGKGEVINAPVNWNHGPPIPGS